MNNEAKDFLTTVTYIECDVCARQEAERARFKMNTVISIRVENGYFYVTMSKRMWGRFGRLLNNSSFRNYGTVDEDDLMRQNYDGVKALECNLQCAVNVKEAADILAKKDAAINFKF
jgi:hypothetical protein